MQKFCKGGGIFKKEGGTAASQGEHWKTMLKISLVILSVWGGGGGACTCVCMQSSRYTHLPGFYLTPISGYWI